MSEVKNVPEIRFKGFEDEWKTSKLEKIIELKSGRDYKHLNKGNIPVYGTGGYMLSVDEALSQVDAIGIGRKGTIDSPYILRAPFWTVDTLFYAVPKTKCNLYFVFDLFQRINWKKHDESSGLPSLSKNTINSVVIKYTHMDEQTQIGSLFAKLDSLISTSQNKTEKLKDFKRALLQKMFANEKQSVPEIRFKGFEDEWKEIKIKDLAGHTYGGGTPKTSNLDFWKGSIPWIQSSDLILGDILHEYSTKRITLDAVKKSATKIVPKNSIAIVTRVGVGKLALIKTEYSTSQDFLSLSNLTTNETFALYILYISLKKQSENAQGTSIKGITKSDLLNEKLTVSTNDKEQTRIGELFAKLDSIISTSERKTEKLQDLKKVLLQKMFV